MIKVSYLLSPAFPSLIRTLFPALELFTDQRTRSAVYFHVMIDGRA